MALLGANIVAIASAVAWGLTQSYWVEVRRTPYSVRTERGCLIVRHETPIALAWSPPNALENAVRSIDQGFDWTHGRVAGRLQRVENDWDPADAIQWGFVLPHWRAEPNQADFDRGVGWNRNQVLLPLWFLAALGWLLFCVVRWRYSVTERIANSLLAIDGATEKTCFKHPRGCTRPMLKRALIVVGVALTSWTTGHFLFGTTVYNSSARLATNLEILALPDTDETSWNIDSPGLEPAIVGSDAFKKHVSEGIGLLKAKDVAGYRLLIGNVGRIYQGDTTLAHPNQSPPSIEMNLDRYYFSMISFAGTLVHEACHCKLARRSGSFGISGDSASAGTEAELACMQIEVKTLRTLGAPHWEIAAIESQNGTHWRHSPRKYEQ